MENRKVVFRLYCYEKLGIYCNSEEVNFDTIPELLNHAKHVLANSLNDLQDEPRLISTFIKLKDESTALAKNIEFRKAINSFDTKAMNNELGEINRILEVALKTLDTDLKTMYVSSTTVYTGPISIGDRLY